jgi:hypothetical protein
VAPRVTGSRRVGWTAVPAGVRGAVEGLLGGPVVEAVSQPGGFSAGLAARVRVAGGRRAFVKAASARTDPSAAAFHRREAEVARHLPPAAPVPRLLAVHDDGDWVALVFEEVPGRLPALPFRPDELRRVLDTLGDLAAALTPSPVDGSVLAPPRLGGWTGLTARAVAPLAPWAARHVDELVALEARAPAATAGGTLLHGDPYPFNLVLTADRVAVVDWPHAWIGAPHCDVVMFLAGAAALGGVDPAPLAARHPLTRDVDPVHLDVVLALQSGFLLRAAVSAVADADPALVAMMQALAAAALDWLRDRGAERGL